MVEEDRDELELTVLSWDNDASLALADQFVDACAAAVPLWFNS